MELTPKQLEYLLTCLDFHYTEYEGSKDDIIEINASIGRLINHELEQFKKSENTVQEQFINVKPTYTTNIGQTSSIEFAAQEDYSSRIFDTSGASISEGDVLSDGSTVAVTSSGSTNV